MADPGRMSFTMTVPASVPSLFHSSYPCEPSSSREVQGACDVGEVAGVGPMRSRHDVLDQVDDWSRRRERSSEHQDE